MCITHTVLITLAIRRIPISFCARTTTYAHYRTVHQFNELSHSWSIFASTSIHSKYFHFFFLYYFSESLCAYMYPDTTTNTQNLTFYDHAVFCVYIFF